MDEKNLILEQYRIYSEAKEHYIDRAFLINRFYIVVVGIFFVLMLTIKAIRPEAYMALAGIEFFGMMLCFMWFSNQDAYSSIVKIKYSDVLEKMEQDLPKSPHRDEYVALQEKRKDKHIILVKDVQRWFAVFVMMMFIANFLLDSTGLVLNIFFS